MKNIIFIFIMLITKVFVQSQNYNSDIKRTFHWYFGRGAGLDFTSGIPQPDTTRKTETHEAALSESDTCGNLLFYASEDTVWNMSNNIIFTWENVIYGFSTPSQMLAVPLPDHDSIYYIFRNRFQFHNGHWFPFYYHIIKIKADGTHQLLSAYNFLLDSISEKVAACHHRNGRDIWIATKRTGDKNIYAYLLTPDGLNPTPVISPVSSYPGPDLFYERDGIEGMLRFSPNCQFAAVSFFLPELAVHCINKDSIEIYRFNNTTGVFYDKISIPAKIMTYGLCFSPDNTKLYTAQWEGVATMCVDTLEGNPIDSLYPIYQYDLSIYEKNHILNSATPLPTLPFVVGNCLQLAPDGKIYVSDGNMNVYNPEENVNGQKYLGVIEYPNNLGVSCNYIADAIYLGGRSHSIGLPMYVDSYFRGFNYYDCNNSEETENINENIIIYPNPFNDYVYIEGLDANKKYEITIYNIYGIEKEKFTNFKQSQLQLRQLEKGVFILKIKYQQQELNFKIIKL